MWRHQAFALSPGQVEPKKPRLKELGTKRLTLIYYDLLSNFAFNFTLRRYTEEEEEIKAEPPTSAPEDEEEDEEEAVEEEEDEAEEDEEGEENAKAWPFAGHFSGDRETLPRVWGGTRLSPWPPWRVAPFR